MFQVSLVRDDNVSIHLALFAKFFIRTLEIFRNSILQDRRGNFKIFFIVFKNNGALEEWKENRSESSYIFLYKYNLITFGTNHVVKFDDFRVLKNFQVIFLIR